MDKEEIKENGGRGGRRGNKEEKVEEYEGAERGGGKRGWER